MSTVRKRVWLLNHLNTGDGLRNFNPASTGAAGPTFHLLAENDDVLLTESGDFLDIE